MITQICAEYNRIFPQIPDSVYIFFITFVGLSCFLEPYFSHFMQFFKRIRQNSQISYKGLRLAAKPENMYERCDQSVSRKRRKAA